MEDLRLVGVSDDGSTLVTESADGRALRPAAWTSGCTPRCGVTAPGSASCRSPIEGQLRPREIQARIRAGRDRRGDRRPGRASGRHRCAATRARSCSSGRSWRRVAQTVGVRRVTDSATTPLGDAGAEPAAEPRRSTRRAWTGTRGCTRRRPLAGPAGVPRQRPGTPASWLFDAGRRTIEPADDEARWLTDEERAAATAAEPVPCAAAGRRTGRGARPRGRTARHRPAAHATRATRRTRRGRRLR